jgi:DME family drug/metabolite transporter
MVGEWIAIAANFTFALSNTIFRKTERQVSPLFINTFRTMIGLLTFWILAVSMDLFKYLIHLPMDLIGLLIVSILLGQVIGDTAYFKAQHELGVTKALAISLTFPFFTFLLSIFFFDRPFNWVLIPAAGFICVGVLLIGKNYQKELNIPNASESNILKSQIGISLYRGLGWAFLASIVWAFGIILTDLCMNRIDALFATGARSTILGNTIRFPIAVACLWIWLKHERHTENSNSNSPFNVNISKSTWSWLILGALIGTSLGAYLYAEAARTAGASFMALMTAACPLFSVPLNYTFNREKIAKIGFVGVILTIIGIIILFI